MYIFSLCWKKNENFFYNYIANCLKMLYYIKWYLVSFKLGEGNLSHMREFFTERKVFMASNLFQNMMYQLKDVIGRNVGLLDDTVTVIASSDSSMLYMTMDEVEDALN